MKDTIDVTVRRSPKYGAFIITGVVLGAVVAVILSLLPVEHTEVTRQYSYGAALGLLTLICATVGGFLAAVVALIVDRVGSRKARKVTVPAEFEEVKKPRPAADEPATGADEPAPAAEQPTNGADPAPATKQPATGTQNPASAQDMEE